MRQQRQWPARSHVLRRSTLCQERGCRHDHRHRQHRPPPRALGSRACRWCDSATGKVAGGTREIQGKIGGSPVGMRFNGFELAVERRQLLKGGVEIHLTPKAFDLLAVLVAETPRVVQKDELHRRLWPGTFVSDATLVGLIKELRRALEDHDARARLIRTAHGVGYAFAAPIERSKPPQSAVTHWVVVGA